MPSELSITSTIPLPGDLQIPQQGFGVYLSPPSVTASSVLTALETGYRHIDTAQIYRNEEQVGEAVRAFMRHRGLGRGEIWITSKLRDAPGRLSNKRLANVPDLLRESVRKISGGEDGGYVDLMLLHSPYAGPEGRRVQWRGLEDLRREGKVRALGVSNLSVWVCLG